MAKCRWCGLSHKGLGVTILGKVGRKTLTRVARELHVLRVLDAWAFESALIDLHPEVTEIVVNVSEEGKRYRVSRGRFLELATRRVFSPWRGEQLALPRNFWRVESIETQKAAPRWVIDVAA